MSYNTRPVIKSLMARAEKIRSAQYQNSLKKMASLSENDKIQVDLLTKSIVNKILRDPILYLKAGGGDERIEMIKHLFGLRDGKDL